MAALLGQPSYAHLKAAGATLAATPDAAAAFLRQLATVRTTWGGCEGRAGEGRWLDRFDACRPDSQVPPKEHMAGLSLQLCGAAVTDSSHRL